MHYRAVDNRCAVDLKEFSLTLPESRCLEILASKGFKRLDISLTKLSLRLLGTGTYRRGATLAEAPYIFDCSSFIKWIFGKKGIWLPRRSVQQSLMGEPVNICDLRPGDLVFTKSFQNYRHEQSSLDIGHVAMAIYETEVIHATSNKGVVVEQLEKHAGSFPIQSIRRLLPVGRELFTFEIPPALEVEWSDDIRWILPPAEATVL